jgi:pimeloyl-ACP methyl ester carboxylesterase
MRRRRKVSRCLTAAVAACILLSGTAATSSGSIASAALCAGDQSQLQPVTASGHARSLSGGVPVIFVHGINSDAGMWNAKSAAGQIVQMPGVTAWTFDYGHESLDWVTNSSIGPSLADAISCLAKASGHSVIIVAHSMGGLAVQYAIGELGSPASGHVAEVITLGTPYAGSDVLTIAEDVVNGGLFYLDNPTVAFVEALLSVCAGVATNTDINPCWLASAVRAPVGAALESGSPEIRQLPAWPASLPVLDMAGNMDVFIGINNTGFHVHPGDGAVTMSSATDHDTKGKPYELSCSTNLAAMFGAPCFHTSLPYDKQIIAAVDGAIRSRLDSLPPSPSPGSRENAAPGYNGYPNPRYGFTTLWPSSFRAQPPPEDGDGQAWASPDGQVLMAAYGTNNVLKLSFPAGILNFESSCGVCDG